MKTTTMKPKTKNHDARKNIANKGDFAACAGDVSLLETLPVMASRAFGNAFCISRFGPFREHPQRSAQQRLEISWHTETQFAPKFFPSKTNGPTLNRHKK
jgi:hypothetical protein